MAVYPRLPRGNVPVDRDQLLDAHDVLLAYAQQVIDAGGNADEQRLGRRLLAERGPDGRDLSAELVEMLEVGAGRLPWRQDARRLVAARGLLTEALAQDPERIDVGLLAWIVHDSLQAVAALARRGQVASHAVLFADYVAADRDDFAGAILRAADAIAALR